MTAYTTNQNIQAMKYKYKAVLAVVEKPFDNSIEGANRQSGLIESNDYKHCAQFAKVHAKELLLSAKEKMQVEELSILNTENNSKCDVTISVNSCMAQIKQKEDEAFKTVESIFATIDAATIVS